MTPPALPSLEQLEQGARQMLEFAFRKAQQKEAVDPEQLQRVGAAAAGDGVSSCLDFLSRFGFLQLPRGAGGVVVTLDGQRVLKSIRGKTLRSEGEKFLRLQGQRARPQGRPGTGPQRARVPAAPTAGDPRARHKTPADGSAQVPGEAGAERYVQQRQLGQGRLGTVYLAHHAQLRHPVALKQLSLRHGLRARAAQDPHVRRLGEGLGHLCRLVHPNLLPVLDADPLRPHPYLVTEYMVGGSLRDLLWDVAFLPAPIALKVFLQCLHALRHAHRHGISHLRLKPADILFDRAGNARVADMGLAMLDQAEPVLLAQEEAGPLGYEPPELLLGEAVPGPIQDLHALGVILHEMLANRLPEPGGPRPTDLAPDLPPVLDALYAGMTGEAQTPRLTSADEVLARFYDDGQACRQLNDLGARIQRAWA